MIIIIESEKRREVDAMREEKFALDKVNQLNQMHDEVMSGLFIEKDALILAFESCCAPARR